MSNGIKAEVKSIIDSSTVKVSVERRFMHPKYKKFITRSRIFLVHVPSDSMKLQAGESVFIASSKPISKRKKYVIINK